MSKLVRVELGPEGNVIRIFRDKGWRLLPEDSVQLMDKGAAVGLIRMQIYERCGGDSPAGGESHECEECGRSINWRTMEMHEQLAKGKGGEVSLKNCRALCHDCHQGSPDSAHGDRRWQTAKLRAPDA